MHNHDYDGGEPGAAAGRPASPLDVHIGQRLEERRKELNLSADVLARALGISGALFSSHENGEARLSPARLCDAAQALGVPMTWFFEHGEQPGPDSPPSPPDQTTGQDDPQTITNIYLSLKNPAAKHLLHQLALIVLLYDVVEISDYDGLNRITDSLCSELLATGNLDAKLAPDEPETPTAE